MEKPGVRARFSIELSITSTPHKTSFCKPASVELLRTNFCKSACVNLLSPAGCSVVTLLLPHYDSDMGSGMSGEMIFLFFLVLILFGPKKMPEIARQVARMMNEFRRASNEFRSQIESEVNALDISGKDINGKDVNGKAGAARQQILPPLQAPLGSIANRIFNPPSAQKREAAETAVAETAVAEPSAAEQTAIADGASPVSAVEAAAVPASKVAPDA